MPQHRSKKATPARGGSLLRVASIGLGGFLLYAFFNKAKASPAAPAASVPGYSPGNAYTVSALDQSVPGVSFAPSTLQPGILTSTLTAVPAVTQPQVAAAQSFWSTLTPVNPPSSGYITFPSGTQVAAALMSGGNTAQDGNGNLYVQWAGQVYQLGAQDSAGNYPAILAGSVPTAGESFIPGISMMSTQPVDASNLFSLSGFGAAPDLQHFNRQRWG